ncbi:PEP-CTERM sorting domain-containing protein [Aestuariibacter sp. GS-14]|uniref:Npun_F0296 family exosortase-dependent surface protein n=1 Tax=Aestuariibacter sp. GS-14 TaxID=2590670 RepID=UPI00112D1920|nr:PEP-CTERM sorting domain-containing protein [Aestuariibacter sp. GS-14]TPV62095.1 PEP-CTERM sorting domain-containing protein [Aestuariibacter sp. GS-14]
MNKFSSFTKALTLTAAVVLGSSNVANAATITFGGATANDGSGLTSSFIDPVTGGLSGYFIETFDIATGDPTFPGSTAYTKPGFESECAVNSLNGGPIGVDVTASASEIGVRKGTLNNVAAAPANDTTCYGYVTNNGSGTSSITFDYNDLLTYFTSTLSSNTLLGITYLGFYWGSVDTYNDFKFYSGGSLVTQITGSQLLSALGGQSGNQSSPASNTYVNIAFSIADQFDTLVIDTSGIAGEFDNIVIGLSTREIPVPAPTGLALFAFGLVALGLRSRLKR